MKVLFINDLYPPHIKGGAEISTHLIVKGLMQLGVNVRVLTLARSEDDYEYEGVPVTAIEAPNLYWSYDADKQSKARKVLWHLQTPYLLRFNSKIEKIIKDFNPDIIETSVIENFSDRVWAICKLNNLKIIHTLRSYSQLCINANMFKDGHNCNAQCPPCKVLSIVKRRLSQHVDGVIGISNFVLKKHLDYGFFKYAKSAVIPNIYDQISGLKEKSLASNFEKFELGYIGRLHPTKGVEELISSFKRFFDSLDEKEYAYLKIAGTGEDSYVDFLKSTVRGYPIKFLGHQSTSEFFKDIDILVCPSVWEEPFGRVVIESLAHGVPVIGSKRGGIKEIIIDNFNGYLFEPNIENELLHKIEHYYNNFFCKQLTLRENCLLSCEKYSTSNVIALHYEMLKNVLYGN